MVVVEMRESGDLVLFLFGSVEVLAKLFGQFNTLVRLICGIAFGGVIEKNLLAVR